MNLPSDLKTLLLQMLSADPSSRGDINDVFQSPFLNEVRAIIFNFLDHVLYMDTKFGVVKYIIVIIVLLLIMNR